MKCPKCNKDNREGAKSCRRCGFLLNKTYNKPPDSPETNGISYDWKPMLYTAILVGILITIVKVFIKI